MLVWRSLWTLCLKHTRSARMRRSMIVAATTPTAIGINRFVPLCATVGELVGGSGGGGAARAWEGSFQSLYLNFWTLPNLCQHLHEHDHCKYERFDNFLSDPLKLVDMLHAPFFTHFNGLFECRSYQPRGKEEVSVARVWRGAERRLPLNE